MLKQFLLVSVSLLLVSCGGILVYENNNKLFIGPLKKGNLNVMKSTGQVLDKVSNDRMVYAIDASGAYVGACRTKFFKPEDTVDNNSEIPGKFDLHVFNALRQKRFSASDTEIMRKVDAFSSSKWIEATEPASRYLHCYKMGASNQKSHLVIYFQPQGFEESDLDFAIEVDVSGTSPVIVGHEAFSKHSAPTRVVARDNPLKGNTVGILSDRIHINSISVQLNGNPVSADSVKHHFQ